jgi:hypothetical protein
MSKIVLALLGVAITAVSVAQDRPPEPPPEFKEKIEALRRACASDITKFCPNEKGPPQIFCLMKNRESLSKECKKAIDELPKLPAPPKAVSPSRKSKPASTQGRVPL